MRGTPFVFEDFHLGLNTIDAPYTLEPGETRDCMNVVSTTRGAIKKRYGSTAFSTSNPTKTFTSLGQCSIAGTGYLIVSDGEDVYSMKTNGELNKIGTGTAGTFWSIVQAEVGKSKTAGPVYLSNGVDAPKYWAGTEAKTALVEWKSNEAEIEEEKYIATPKAKYLIWANNRMWASGITADPSAVRFTELTTAGAGGDTGDPTLWAEANVVRFDPEDGRPITGIGRVGPYILVFKSHKTWVIFDLDEGENRKLSDNIGCIAHRSIVQSEDGTYFLSTDQGVCVTNGSAIKEVSYKVRPTLDAINPAKREQAAGAYQNNHYYISFASGESTVANRTLDYDLVLKSWWLHDIASNQWVDWDTTAGGEPALFFIPPVSKAGVCKAFVPGVYQDRGANYTGNGSLGAWWIGPWDPFAYYVFRHRVKSPMLKKRVRQIFFDGEGQIIPAVFRNFSTGERQEPAVVGNAEIATQDTLPVDFSAGTELWGKDLEPPKFAVWGVDVPGTETLWGGETTVGSARIYSPGVSRVWAVGWGNNSKEPFTVYSYALMASFRKS